MRLKMLILFVLSCSLSWVFFELNSNEYVPCSKEERKKVRKKERKKEKKQMMRYKWKESKSERKTETKRKKNVSEKSFYRFK